jgi:hypothetical protein
MHAYPYYIEFDQALRVREGHSSNDSKGGSKMRAGRDLGRGRSCHGKNNEKASRSQGMSAWGEIGFGFRTPKGDSDTKKAFFYSLQDFCSAVKQALA